MQLSDQHAIAKATVRDSSGRVLAVAHKREDKAHFADFLEKAETGALGRAAGLVGYGTQFAADFDEGAKVVDSPMPQPQKAAAPKLAMPQKNTAFGGQNGKF